MAVMLTVVVVVAVMMEYNIVHGLLTVLELVVAAMVARTATVVSDLECVVVVSGPEFVMVSVLLLVVATMEAHTVVTLATVMAPPLKLVGSGSSGGQGLDSS